LVDTFLPGRSTSFSFGLRAQPALGSLAGGMTQSDIAHEYGITVDDITAALEFAAELVDDEQFHPLPTR